MIVNVGEAHIVVNLLTQEEAEELGAAAEDESHKGAKLKLKVFGGPTSGEVFYFKNDGGQEILIGRTPNCDVRIDDKLLSKT